MTQYCCRPPQPASSDSNIFFVYTQSYAASAAPLWAIMLSPRFTGLKIPLTFGSPPVR